MKSKQQASKSHVSQLFIKMLGLSLPKIAGSWYWTEKSSAALWLHEYSTGCILHCNCLLSLTDIIIKNLKLVIGRQLDIIKKQFLACNVKLFGPGYLCWANFSKFKISFWTDIERTLRLNFPLYFCWENRPWAQPVSCGKGKEITQTQHSAHSTCIFMSEHSF